MKRASGKYQHDNSSGEKISSFVPIALSKIQPTIKIDQPLLDQAKANLEQLNLLGDLLPSVSIFVYGFVNKEALISSQIEGTQATLVDILSYELEESVSSDVEEVCNYIRAFKYAQKQIDSPNGLPISIRLLNAVHEILMKGVRVQDKMPGQIRTSQNWIGGARPGNAIYVPPPSSKLSELLHDLELYIHKNKTHDPLVKAALIHYQFETIHPYLDGNGRIGRLLIALLLQDWKMMNYPLLYLSLYFKKHQKHYYSALTQVRENGNYEQWLTFFLEGVSEIAKSSSAIIKKIVLMVDQDRNKIIASDRGTMMMLKIHEFMLTHPIVSSSILVEKLKSTKPTINKALGSLLNLQIVQEKSGKKRDRLYGYKKYIQYLNQS